MRCCALSAALLFLLARTVVDALPLAGAAGGRASYHSPVAAIITAHRPAAPSRRSPVDYPGGFDGSGHCVAICPEGGSSSAPRDWDFLMLEQLFVPQYCRMLEAGLDVTLSHPDVRRFPAGAQ